MCVSLCVCVCLRDCLRERGREREIIQNVPPRHIALSSQEDPNHLCLQEVFRAIENLLLKLSYLSLTFISLFEFDVFTFFTFLYSLSLSLTTKMRMNE